jgi:mannose-6-phosphate isomerase
MHSSETQHRLPHEVIEDERPWGRFRQYTRNATTTVKIITVEAGEELSLQRHAGRDEFWVVLDDGLSIQIDDDAWDARAGDEFFVPRGSIHRVGARVTARFLEIAFGQFDEDDIERIEDRYGRSV